VAEVKPRSAGAEAFVFRRVAEPRENAFSLVVPDGWHVEGGIFRVDPAAGGGPANSIAAKVDFAVKRDAAGSVAIRWLPDVLFFDPRHSPAGQMGLLGPVYQGMPVTPLMPAARFLSDVAFRQAHPQASGIEVAASKALPELSRRYEERVRQFPFPMTFSYDAAVLDANYSEGAARYRERLFAVVENWGQMGAGMWGNKDTVLMRAPEGEFDRWARVMSVVQNSVRINQQWLLGELRGQAQRGEIAIRTQQEIERIGREIAAHRQTTNAEIHNDMFLTLTGQEEYVNPYTREVEVDSDAWRHRWVNESGDVVFSDAEEYDPNVDIRLNRSGYKRTRVRPR
jgi:hypothetical protein